MQNPVIDAQVSKLIEENEELKNRINELEKTVQENQRNDVHDLKEMLIQIKEFNEKLVDFSNTIQVLQTRKEWIDKIIEKIKKILPI